jgi:hypothetical protein
MFQSRTHLPMLPTARFGAGRASGPLALRSGTEPSEAGSVGTRARWGSLRPGTMTIPPAPRSPENGVGMRRTLLRTAGVALALAAGCALVLGCGSTKSASGTAAPVPTSPSSSASHGPATGSAVTRSQAVAYAHEVNLRASDVPQMTARSSEREKTSVAPAAFEVSRCAGATDPSLRVADVHSPRFVAGMGTARETVKSDVEVKPSAAIAARDAGAIRSARGLACVTHFLEHRAQEPTLTTQRITRQVAVHSLTAPLPAASGSFEVRIVVTTSAARPGGRLSARSYFDALGFVSGPAEVALTATHSTQPPSAETEHRLLELLYGRAKAHRLR